MRGIFKRSDASKNDVDPKPDRSTSNLNPALVEAVYPSQEATSPADYQYVSIGLPPYVVKQIRQRALEESTTIRFEILRCISEGGFDVNDVDLVPDARKSKR